ncbi:MAG: hypothetical protein FWC28_00810 [Proteobacteria bacterium]|nr:hypothetical protein [Cystobacterineae bacterium]MCL2313783.1 hypothetical protein [Pseudomonadota bacterium]
MRLLVAYLNLYKESLLAALAGTFKNAWTFLLPAALLLTYHSLGLLLSPHQWLGGILFMLAMDALLSTYLYFVCQIVEGSKTSLREWKISLGRYFWAIVSFFFALWVGSLLLQFLLSKHPQWPAISLGVQILCLVAFNAAPETLYVKNTRGSLETVRQSFKFMQENWIAWLLPNVLFGLGAWYFMEWNPLHPYAMLTLLGAFFHLVMAFRGVLFVKLDKSTHRQRLHRLGR